MDRVEVLDHGYVSLVETWGSDERIVEAARMSTGKGFLGWGGHCKVCCKTPEEAAATLLNGRDERGVEDYNENP